MILHDLVSLDKNRTRVPDLYKHVSVIALDRERTNLLAAYEGLAKLGAKAEATTPLLYAKLRAAMAGENLYLGENVAGGLPGPPGRGRAPSEDAEFYLSVLKRISPDDTEIIKTYKFLAGPLNTNNLRRLSALKVLVEWAGDEKDRRKEVYPFIKAGLVDRNTVLDCIKYVGGFGELAKDAVPILKQLKLSDEKTIRDAATKAVELIENP